MNRLLEQPRFFIGAAATCGVSAALLFACVGDAPQDVGTSGNDAAADVSQPSIDGSMVGMMDAGTTPMDAGTTDAADSAPPPRCTISKPFGAATPVMGVNDPNDNDSHAVLSDDELNIYWVSDHQAANHFHVYTASRASQKDAFSSVSPLQGPIVGQDERHPTISGDGTILIFDSTAVPPVDAGPGIGADHIAMATRANQAVNFGTPSFIYTQYVFNGALTGNAGAIYGENLQTGNITRLAKNGTTYGPQLDLVNVGNDYTTTSPVSRDDLTLYVATGTRPSAHAGDNIWVYTRPNTSSAYLAPTELTTVNTDGSERPSWLSPDGCNLYIEYMPMGGTTTDIWVASRPL